MPIQANIESCNGFISHGIDVLSDGQVEISFAYIQIETIEHILLQIEANFFSNSVGGVLLGKKREHEIAGVAQIHEGEFKLIMVVMVKHEVIDLLASALQQIYTKASRRVRLGRATWRNGPVV